MVKFVFNFAENPHIFTKDDFYFSSDLYLWLKFGVWLVNPLFVLSTVFNNSFIIYSCLSTYFFPSSIVFFSSSSIYIYFSSSLYFFSNSSCYDFKNVNSNAVLFYLWEWYWTLVSGYCLINFLWEFLILENKAFLGGIALYVYLVFDILILKGVSVFIVWNTSLTPSWILYKLDWTDSDSSFENEAFSFVCLTSWSLPRSSSFSSSSTSLTKEPLFY